MAGGQGRHAEQEALAEGDAEIQEDCEVVLALDALRDDRGVAFPGHARKRADRGAPRAGGGDAPHEPLIDLEELRLRLRHEAEVRVARADVVERDAVALAAVVVQRAAEESVVGDGDALRHLEDHVFRRDAEASQHLRRQAAGEGGVEEALRLDVEAQHALRLAAERGGAAGEVEGEEEPLLPRGLEEGGRGAKGPNGSARQGLVREDRAAGEPDDGLVCGFDQALSEHVLEIQGLSLLRDLGLQGISHPLRTGYGGLTAGFPRGGRGLCPAPNRLRSFMER